MNAYERKQRIRQLWSKVRLFVSLRRRMNNVRYDMEKRELQKMLDQPISTDPDNSDSEGEYSDSDALPN